MLVNINKGRIIQRFRAFSLHFFGSLLIVGAAIVAMRLVWYPTPFGNFLGWTELLWVVVGVDIVLGPVLTFVIYLPGKKSLRFDITVIVLVQISALTYGIYTSAIGRPVYLVFMNDRFEGVTAEEYPKEEREAAKDGQFKDFPWFGPDVVAATMPQDSQEKNRVIFSAVAGGGLKVMPRYYSPYITAAKTAAAKGKYLPYIQRTDPQQTKVLSEWIESAKRNSSNVVFVPLKVGFSYGTVMLDSTSGNILGMRSIDPSWY